MTWCHRTMLAYWKFESISLQQRVNKLSVPEEGYRSGRSSRRVDEQVVACGVVIPDRDPERRVVLTEPGQQGSPPTRDGYRNGRSSRVPRRRLTGAKGSPQSSLN